MDHKHVTVLCVAAGLIEVCFRIRSSRACGPFVSYNTSWEVVPRVVSQLPPGLRSFLHALASEAFAVSFFVITW